MAVDFLKNLIKEYRHWEVYIYENQNYLGRCVVWCRRENALDLTDATEGEQEELFLILRNLREALKKSFQPDWFNYAFLGNETRHLHCHFIPRYAKPRKFMGVVFKDKLYGHNYKTDHNFQISATLLETLRDNLKSLLQ